MPTPARVAVVPQEMGQPLRIESVDLPDPGPTDVVVRQFASGVCHSQLHEIHTPRASDVVLGHEATGEVVAVGSEVNHVNPGDRVFVTWLPRSTQPPDRRPAPAQVVQGDGTSAVSLGVFTWADHTIADEMYIVPMPDDVPVDVTSIVGCAVMTGAGAVMNTAGVTAGSSVAVFGVGGVGCSALSAAKALGADPIIAVDLTEEKLEFARSHGATLGVNASECDPVARIRELTPRDGLDLMGAPCAGVDFAFDCIGAEATIGQVAPSLRSKRWGSDERAVAVLVGIPISVPAIDVGDLLMHEKHLTGSIGGTSHPERDFPIFMDWYRRGDLDLDSMVTQRFALDEINEAVDALQRGQISGRAILVFD